MEPQSERTPGLHLPQPSSEEGVSPYGRYEEMPQKQEASPEVKHNVSPMAPATNDAATSMQSTPLATTMDDSGPAHGAQDQPTNSSASDDEDELDREWVNKAKLIVEQTKADPYTQSKEIGKAKADYLRIRYNKHINVGQDQTL